ncbi:MAG: phosphopyruvate hydratase [Candidatus Hydrothermarchaeales archaeon]
MNSTIIEDVKARKIVDSRGNWTIEVDIITNSGFGRCAAPSGASTGKYEVKAFPNGVDKSILKIEKAVAPELVGMDSEEQERIDSVLKGVNGTKDFSNVGGNAAVAVSLANARAAANALDLPLYHYLGSNFSTDLPFPLGNVIGGGVHAFKGPDIQEFLVLPVGAPTIDAAVQVNSKVHKLAGEFLKGGNKSLGRGDEGAWAPDLKDSDALETLSKACSEASDATGIELRLGVDVAASELWDAKKEKYVYKKEGVERSREEQIAYIFELIKDYSLYYVEDPLEENDFDGFAELTKKAGCLICGDDLYATNTERMEKGIEIEATNSALIKPNQCGTLTDTYRAINLAKNKDLVPVLSHRSGETPDDTIAHLAVAFKCPIIKAGIVGGERIAKLNELIRIAEELMPQHAKMATLLKF